MTKTKTLHGVKCAHAHTHNQIKQKNLFWKLLLPLKNKFKKWSSRGLPNKITQYFRNCISILCVTGFGNDMPPSLEKRKNLDCVNTQAAPTSWPVLGSRRILCRLRLHVEFMLPPHNALFLLLTNPQPKRPLIWSLILTHKFKSPSPCLVCSEVNKARPWKVFNEQDWAADLL